MDNMMVVGVYLSHNDNTAAADEKTSQLIVQLTAIKKQNDTADKMTLIVGDWNMDPVRKNRYDKHLNDVLESEEMIALENYHTEIIFFNFVGLLILYKIIYNIIYLR
jgi:exonuclease III